MSSEHLFTRANYRAMRWNFGLLGELLPRCGNNRDLQPVSTRRMSVIRMESLIVRLIPGLLLVTACSGSPGNVGGNTGGTFSVGGATNGGSDSVGGSSNGGSTAFPVCGTQVCASNQLCIHPTCAGGVAPACIALNDAGACPSGWTLDNNCSNLTTRPGCRPPTCVNPPPFCASIPGACGTSITCGCMPANICSGNGSCGLIQNGKDVVCMSA